MTDKRHHEWLKNFYYFYTDTSKADTKQLGTTVQNTVFVYYAMWNSKLTIASYDAVAYKADITEQLQDKDT